MSTTTNLITKLQSERNNSEKNKNIWAEHKIVVDENSKK